MSTNMEEKNLWWASWPLDFDPVWVEECKLFASKEEEKE